MNNILNNNSKLENKNNDLIPILAFNLSQEIPQKTRIFIYDFPGKFAFYSNFNVIAADGLIANKNYFKELNNLRFKKFLQSNKISYLILPYYLNKKTHISSIGIKTEGYHKKIKYYIKNSLEKKVVDTLKVNEIYTLKTYVNPIKNWQNDYDSIRVYKIK